MAFYLIVIAIANVLICAASLLFFMPVLDTEWWIIVLGTVWSTVMVIAIDGLFAFIVRRLPEKWFRYGNKMFEVSKRERKFYNRLKIKAWKDKVPELGMFTAFSKSRVTEPQSAEYVARFLLESNYGIWCHIADIVFGGLVVLCMPLKFALYIGMPVAAVNAVLNLLPILILRYNTPGLTAMYKRNIKKKERETDSV